MSKMTYDKFKGAMNYSEPTDSMWTVIKMRGIIQNEILRGEGK